MKKLVPKLCCLVIPALAYGQPLAAAATAGGPVPGAPRPEAVAPAANVTVSGRVTDRSTDQGLPFRA